jgi:hypothetical protein
MVPTFTYVLIIGIPIVYLIACLYFWFASKKWLT